MQLPDSVQNILAYGQGYKDGMKDGHTCGFHDALVCNVHDLTALLKKYCELEKEYAGLQVKAMKEHLENMPQFEQPPERKHGRWIECDYKTLEHGEIESAYKAGLCCSECRTGFKKNHMTYKAFCPACGAKMDAAADQGGGADNG